MPRSPSAIMSVDVRKAQREEKKALGAQIRDAKVVVREATRALKAAQKELDKLTTQQDKVNAKLVKDREARKAA